MCEVNMLVCVRMILLITCAISGSRSIQETRVKKLILDWAPLVWLAPGEHFLPLGVPEFLDNMDSDDDYLRTKINVESLLKNSSSFLYGRKPAGTVPVYALVRNCVGQEGRGRKEPPSSRPLQNERDTSKRSRLNLSNSKNLFQGEDFDLIIQTNDVSGAERSSETTRRSKLQDAPDFKKQEENRFRKLHFHVTYWMFYPFSEGKAVCVLDLGFFGSWPIPTVGGTCLGILKEYGNHVGDWEHMSLYFKGNKYPTAMYVSAHDAGAFYRFDSRSGIFVYESQETRKGIFQKPIFPERVYTAGGSHPVLFSARGSHGLWTAPGKHKFVRLPRLYDESGFGTAWPTWKKVEVLEEDAGTSFPSWMNFKGKWGNPRSNCHPLAKLGFNICEFVDGPAGIPMKKPNFQC